MAVIVPGRTRRSSPINDESAYKCPRIDPPKRGRKSSRHARRSSADDAGLVARRIASETIDAALTCLEQLLQEIPADVAFRFAEYAWMFATCSCRLPPPFNERTKASAFRLLSLWQHYRQRTSDTYLEDLYAFKTFSIVGFESDVEFQAHSNVYKRWRARPHPELLDEDDTRYGRWDRFLENALDVWATQGLKPDDDGRIWSYIKRWESRLYQAVYDMRPRLAQENFPLNHSLSLVQALSYFVLILTEYGTKMASPEHADYISKRYYQALNRVASLYEVDVSLDNNNWLDRSLPIMQLVFASYLLQKPLNPSLEQALNEALTSGVPVPGLFHHPDEWTYFARLDRVYCCILAMACWSGLILPAETSPCLLAHLNSNRNTHRNTPEPTGTGRSSSRAARRSSGCKLPSSTESKAAVDALVRTKGPVQEKKVFAQNNDFSIHTAVASHESVQSGESSNKVSIVQDNDSAPSNDFVVQNDLDFDKDAILSHDNDFQGNDSVQNHDAALRDNVIQNNDAALNQEAVVNNKAEPAVDNDPYQKQRLFYRDRSLMPARRISRFAFTSFDHVPMEYDARCQNGIVVLPGLLRDFIASNEVYGRIVGNCERLSQGFTVWLSNKQNIEPADSMYRSDTWDDVLLYRGIHEYILPLLISKLGPLAMVKDANGNELRTVRVCMRSKGESDHRHRDMGFYEENLPQLNGIAYRLYTVWMLLSNNTSRSPLTFIDGSGCSHDGPSNGGDVVVYSSCIQLEARPVPDGRWVSVDFGILVKDKSY